VKRISSFSERSEVTAVLQELCPFWDSASHQRLACRPFAALSAFVKNLDARPSAEASAGGRPAAPARADVWWDSGEQTSRRRCRFEQPHAQAQAGDAHNRPTFK
jgi:hypothetical protein